ncbi:alpha-hydroxy-acid oxidizing protein [Halococcus thailandensis]|uniref:FMN-dependent alpha-hydroxy acid dehydrogenase n=1 Tax=Halococcus thailandensis JCM 13552 TaxID=1227457 RepID=M0N5U2_9EURY|nr:alpha-hydroxy-acid oxidizing protein [Halococcus thailandensis]EMA52035.1 FMN-dependent alpha-hydroxy acid dehydrogenase [Halococcus thailandensis JCM 13552]
MSDDPSEPYGEHRQRDVYASGMLADDPPEHPVRYEELERRAMAAMSEEAAAYVAGGAGTEDTITENRRAFADWRIVPRVLRNVSERDLRVDLFGTELDLPILLAPLGVLSIVHEAGELAVARAAAEHDVPMVLSSASSYTMEEVAEELGETPKWFQLYWSADPDIASSFVERAEHAGYDAIVVTLDTPLLGWRERDIEQGYLPFLDGEGVANYVSDPAFRDRLDVPPEENEGTALMEFVDIFGDPSLTWDDLASLRAETDLPLIVKGVLHPDDAERAVECGADGVVVSNHGGRQVDGAIGALTALPGVVDAVGDVPVLFDSGIRSGADAVKAIALGADAVLLGRPYAYGLALDGEAGVGSVLENFRADLDLTLALAGHTSFDELDRSILLDRRPSGVDDP